MAFPKEFKYTRDHEYIDPATGKAGLTNYAQEQLGDIVFVDLPPVGKVLKQGEVFATVESVKAVSDCYTPAGGKVVKVNEKLVDDPGLINRDPHGEGWMVVIEITEKGDLDKLMDEATYDKYQAEAGSHH